MVRISEITIGNFSKKIEESISLQTKFVHSEYKHYLCQRYLIKLIYE